MKDGATSGSLFLASAERPLCKALRPGDVVVMANLASHKVKGVGKAIDGVCAEVFCLPTYCPNVKPVELVFSESKQLTRIAKR